MSYTDEQAPHEQATLTAGEAGWRVSRYNLMAKVPDSPMTAIANLYRGTCAEYTPLELYLLSVLDRLDERHPIIERFASRGVIVNFDERAALETMGRAAVCAPREVGLVICPTMGCNFDCPYCFEDHRSGKMAREVQDDVVALASRMIRASGCRSIHVSWFGGEPLLAPDVIEGLSERLMSLAREHECTYTADITTNGYLLTQDVVNMLDAAKVRWCQITIDGIGEAHDATRHLAGGGPTFERIVDNLRNTRIPFSTLIRHNVHEGNRDQVNDLMRFVHELAEESGNKLSYYPAPVRSSKAADTRGNQVGLLCGTNASDVGIRQEAERFSPGRGHYCCAHTLWSVGIDDKGNLQKCWEAVDKPYLAFGTAHEWDPANPLATARNLDNLTRFVATCSPVPDDECRECVMLPLCAGGCPYQRLFGRRLCVPFRDNPESYVLALHARKREAGNREETA